MFFLQVCLPFQNIVIVYCCFKIRRDFISLLSEKSVTRRTKWSSLKKQIEDDERYKAVDRSSTRESLFREYQDTLPEESTSVRHISLKANCDMAVAVCVLFIQDKAERTEIT